MIFISISDFPLHVEIKSFSYDADMKPTVHWTKIESGNCLVLYFVEVTNSTGGKVQKGPTIGSSVIVDAFKEPKDVTVFAMDNGALPKGFVKIGFWQIGYQPNDSQATPFNFTNTMTGQLGQQLIDTQGRWMLLFIY